MHTHHPKSLTMKTLSMLATLAGAFAVSGCVAASADESDMLDEPVDVAEQAIVNGSSGFAKKSSFSVIFDHGPGTQESGCSAVALTTKWLLTAAHCVYDENGSLYPYAFAPYAGDIVQIVPHPAFAPYAASSSAPPLGVPDVALLRLETPLNLYSDDCSYAPNDCWKSPAGMPIPVNATSSGYTITSYYPTFAIAPGSIVCDGSGGSASGLLPSHGVWSTADTYYEGGYYQAIPPNAAGQTMTSGDSGGPCYFNTGARNASTLLAITSSITKAGGQTVRTNAVITGYVASFIDSVIPQNDRVLVVPNDPGAGL
ncbi:trypsin-like serine protease [Polyangium sp. y55x31]|uniref:trypsin-like serine protease n=1 Tax=Polyangium sp. y55x31 TaxID=3042688 RepID=UPI0024828369|nr:trypsin-like serine protease [Polyangium sp. y55x31]MDI1475359.1 trypsin-like serine protease [Polyangium sp. y55x31]